MLMITFTPLRGMTGISTRFREEFSPDRTCVQMGIDDVPAEGHIRPEDRARIIDGYPEHEREARSRGEPMLGEGKVTRPPRVKSSRTRTRWISRSTGGGDMEWTWEWIIPGRRC
jgi:hypothetical protein